MGDFAGTCALSRLGILEGDEVYVIAYTRLSDGSEPGTYNLLNSFSNVINRTTAKENSLEDALEWLQKRYEAGQIKDLEGAVHFAKWQHSYKLRPRTEGELLQDFHLTILQGNYSGYGWIEGVERLPEIVKGTPDPLRTAGFHVDEKTAFVFIRKDIADEMISQVPMSDEDHRYREVLGGVNPLLPTAYMIVLVAFWVRAQLTNHDVLGYQYCGHKTEHMLRKHLLKLSLKVDQQIYNEESWEDD